MSPVLNPIGPYSFVTDRLALGGVLAYGEDLSRFDFCLNVAKELEQYGAIRDGNSWAHCGFDDVLDIDSQLPQIERAVRMVVERRLRGETILITCAQGRNRSGVVLAEALIQTSKATPAEVVRVVQERRANALTNRAFVAWLLRRRGF